MTRDAFLVVVWKQSDELCPKTVGTTTVGWHHKHVPAKSIRASSQTQGNYTQGHGQLRQLIFRFRVNNQGNYIHAQGYGQFIKIYMITNF